jgi:TolA-binding protein
VKSSGKTVARTLVAVAALSALALAGCSTRGGRLYRRAEAFFAQGKYELAAAEYRRIVDEQPRDAFAPDAEYKLAYIYREFYRNVPSAIATYWDLATRYPRSGYADDALFWVVWLQARRLKDPAAVAATCAQVDTLQPENTRLRARCLVELARAQSAAGQLDEAAKTARKVVGVFMDQPRAGADASLIIAEVAKKQGGDSKTVLDLYEQVIAHYPDTPAAGEAKRAIGWLYYGQKNEDAAKQRQEALRKSRVIDRVASYGAEELTAPSRTCDALRALLRSRGENATLADVMAVSGAAFVFPYSSQSPAALPAPSRLLEAAAAEYGFTYKVGGSDTPEEAYTILEQSVLHDRPVLIAYPSPRISWVVVVGCRATENKVLVLLPGHQGPTAIDKAAFLSRWASVREGPWGMSGAARFYQFALDARTSTPPVSSLLEAALRRGVEGIQRRELGGVVTGTAAWDAVTQELSACASDQDPARRNGIVAWARGTLVVHIANADACSEFLARAAGQVPASGLAADAAETFADCALQMRALRNEIMAGPTSGNDAWTAASSRAQIISGRLKKAAEQMQAAEKG